MTCSVVAAWARPKAWPNSWRATEPQVPPAPLVGAARERSSRSNTTSAWEIQAFGLPQDQRLLTCPRPTPDPATRESTAGTNEPVNSPPEVPGFLAQPVALADEFMPAPRKEHATGGQ